MICSLRKTIVIFLALVCCISCTDDDESIFPPCGVDSPIKGLAWLKAEIERREASPSEDMKYCYIVQMVFEGATFFEYRDCNPLIDKNIPIYDCAGTLINSGESFLSFDDLKQETIIWRPDNFVCDTSFETKKVVYLPMKFRR